MLHRYKGNFFLVSTLRSIATGKLSLKQKKKMQFICENVEPLILNKTCGQFKDTWTKNIFNVRKLMYPHLNAFNVFFK